MKTTDDDLIESVRSSLRRQADQVNPSAKPFDPDHVAARPLGVEDELAARRGRGRALVAVAAGIVLVLMIAGVALVRGGGEDAVQTVANPDGVLNHVLPPLAPTGVEWWIDDYRPQADGLEWASYRVKFDLDGRAWTLVVGANGHEPDEVPIVVGDRSVSMVGSTPESSDVSLAVWRDPSGAFVDLGATTGAGDAAHGFSELDSPMPRAEMADVVARIQPVDDETWLAALNPPQGAVYPLPDAAARGMNTTTRPLHLGLAASPRMTRLNVQPWFRTESELDVDGHEAAAFRLVTTTMSPPATTLENPPEDAVSVRGADGRLVTADGTEQWPGVPDYSSRTGVGVPGYNRSISWSEGGSFVQLQFRDGPTVDDAVAVANSLVVLDDTQWTALLFPAGSSD